MSGKQSNPKIKIAVLGKGVVGKSSLTYRLINYNAPDKHDPTIEDRYLSSMIIDDKTYVVEILDTAGEEDFQNMIDMWINFAEGFLLVFAINDKESFEILKKKRERIIKAKKDTFGIPPIVLVGNKQDLDKERQIQFADAKQEADSWNAEYIETSAKTNFQCKEAFEKLARKIIAHKSKKKKEGCPSCTIV